jgi:hypothetical protein
MKLFQILVTLVSLSTVTGFVIIASPRSSTCRSSMQMAETDQVIQFEQDGHEFTASEGDVEKLKQIVTESSCRGAATH